MNRRTRKLEDGRWTIFPRTVIGQLVLSMIVVQALVLASFLYLGARSQFKLQTQRDTARVEAQATLFARQTVEDAQNTDLADMKRTAEAMRSSAAVLTARVFAPDGKLVVVNDIGARNVDDAEREAIKLCVQDARYYHIPADGKRGQEGFAPIVVNGKVAYVASIIADAEIGSRAMWIFIRNAILYSVCALLANLVLAFLVGRTIAKPIARLNKATQQIVRDSDSSTAFPLPVTTRNEAGQLTHSFNVMVRDLKQQRNGLTDTLALLDSMLVNAPVGFAFFDKNHNIVRANLFLERIYGGIAKQARRSIRQAYPAPMADAIGGFVSEVFETGTEIHDKQISSESEVAGSNSRAWICSFYPVKPDGETTRWVGMVMTEVTNRVREEEAMRRSEKLAAAGRLAASIAHEINNPLESVTNLLYLLRIHPSLDAEAAGFADLAQRELRRVSEITQQTLRFYRSSSRPEDVRLDETIASVLTLHAARLQAAAVHVQQETDDAARIFGFSGELRQVFANLIGNAADAMPGGGRLRVRVRHRTSGVYVLIADSGTGMSAKTAAHIFEPFYTTKEATGTGLGLWVSDEIVRKHGGTIRVRTRQSGNGRPSGTVFRVFLPAKGVSRPD